MEIQVISRSTAKISADVGIIPVLSFFQNVCHLGFHTRPKAAALVLVLALLCWTCYGCTSKYGIKQKL